jgi:hypothetical protein
MASQDIMPRKDLHLLAHARVGDMVGTRFGDAKVTPLMKKRAAFALHHFDEGRRKD